MWRSPAVCMTPNLQTSVPGKQESLFYSWFFSLRTKINQLETYKLSVGDSLFKGLHFHNDNISICIWIFMFVLRAAKNYLACTLRNKSSSFLI